MPPANTKILDRTAYLRKSSFHASNGLPPAKFRVFAHPVINRPLTHPEMGRCGRDRGLHLIVELPPILALASGSSWIL